MSSWGICFANKPQAIELGYKKISKARIGLSRIEIALMGICFANKPQAIELGYKKIQQGMNWVIQN